MKLFSKDGGFTLIELLLVIAIIGLLASIITASLSAAQKKGRDAKRIADIKTIQLALETYFSDKGSYPQQIYNTINAGTNQLAVVPYPAFAPYLPVMPLDPSDNLTQYKYDAWPNGSGSWTICTGSNTPIGYHLGAGLEDTSNSSLLQDRDMAARTSGQSCINDTNNLDGTSPTASHACGNSAGTAQPGGTEGCYDVSSQ